MYSFLCSLRNNKKLDFSSSKDLINDLNLIRIRVERLRVEINNRKITFHDGLKEPINSERLLDLETEAIMGRLFSGGAIDATTLFEQLGSSALDFTNIHDWSEEIPDISSRSARIFTVWADDTQTNKIFGIARGFFVIVPFRFSLGTAEEYYKFLEDTTPYYPMAIITALKYVPMQKEFLDTFLRMLRKYLSLKWVERRDNTINSLKKGSDLWKRYVFSFKELIYFSFQCPSIDRELIDSLQRNNYRITGIMQLLASPSPSYDTASINHFISAAQKKMADFEKEENMSKEVED